MYLAIILCFAGTTRFAEVPYVAPLLWTVGQSFVVIGGVAALLMAMAEWEHFWIANVIYLAFVLSAILG